MTLRWLFLDLNSYFASVEQAENPALRGKPVAVVPMAVDTTVCLAASYPAKQRGVRTGTTVRDAKRLCPGIVFVEADHRRYTSYHRRIVETVERCLPVSKVMSIDEMACGLMGRERDEGFARAKALEIKRAIAEEVGPALTCSIGIAPNRYLAKVASDMQKPDGLTVLHEEELPQRLFALSVRDLPGIGPRMEERLFAKRCTSVEKLCSLSPKELREIWGGNGGEKLWQILRGVELEERESKRASISHSKVLAPQRRNRDDAWAVAVRLVSKAAMRLREEGFYTRELWLTMRFLTRQGEGVPRWHAHVSVEETQDSVKLIEALEAMYRRAPEGTILRIGVALSRFVPAGRHQVELFADPRREDLMRVLDDINRRYRTNKLYFASSHSARNTAGGHIAFQHIPSEHE